jgi:7-cyano-7-deazaguanine tRNA-ribosyltransferase
LKPATDAEIRKLRGVASYQFGKEASLVLVGRDTKISRSKRTGRIRHIYRRDKLIATLRPKDGYLALTIDGSRLILSKLERPSNIVIALNEVAEFVRSGGDLFAKHVVRADETLRPADEAIVTDENRSLVGVGRAVLSGREMKFFKRGVAVKIRRGVSEQDESRASELRDSDCPDEF